MNLLTRVCVHPGLWLRGDFLDSVLLLVPRQLLSLWGEIGTFPLRICKLVKVSNKIYLNKCKMCSMYFFLFCPDKKMHFHTFLWPNCFFLLGYDQLTYLFVQCESSPWHFQYTHFRSAPLAVWPAICPFSTMHCGIPLLNPRVKIEYTFPAITSALSSKRRAVTHPNYPFPSKPDQSLPEPC